MTGSPPIDAALRALTLQGGHNTTVVMIGAALLGLTAGVVGSFALLRGRSLLADAVSHAGLPGVGLAFLIALALGIEARSLPVLLAGAACAGLLAAASVHLIAKLPRMHEDAAIGAALSVFFAIGVALLSIIQSLPTGNQAGLSRFILGQAASMNAADARTMALAAGVTLAVTALLFKELRLVCFDRAFASSLGVGPAVVDGALLALIVAVTVIGMQAVGAILVVALLIIPAAAARFWTERLARMAVISAALGGASCWIGVAASAGAPSLPTGPLIVLSCAGAFLVSMLLAPRRGVVAHAVRRAADARAIDDQHLLRALYELEELGLAATTGSIARRRAWGAGRVARLLARAARRGDAAREEDRWTLTGAGRARAERTTRNHRLWELYLIEHGRVKPSRVDDLADTIEHAVDPAIVARLERLLASRAGAAPPSPHPISSGGEA